MRLLCPCCEQEAEPRTTPLTELEARKAFAMMAMRGWTRDRLLDERAETLDIMAPGFTEWLRRSAH
jgi:hypothetical protein